MEVSTAFCIGNIIGFLNRYADSLKEQSTSRIEYLTLDFGGISLLPWSGGT